MTAPKKKTSPRKQYVVVTVKAGKNGPEGAIYGPIDDRRKAERHAAKLSGDAALLNPLPATPKKR